MLILYSFAVLTSAFLLFFMQPMFARMILPLLGGSPAVWNTAMVFYQATLLAGYLYAHALTHLKKMHWQVILHGVLMMSALLWLPIHVPPGWAPPAEGNPAPWLLWLLSLTVGLPFFVISASSPLLQRWFAWTWHRHSTDPYFLYAFSNMGSVLALIVYPTLAEPRLRLAEQAWWWTSGFCFLIALTGSCAFLTWSIRKHIARYAASSPDSAGDSTTFPGKTEIDPATVGAAPAAVTAGRRLRWVLLAFVPSSLMLSVTTFLTTDIASVPMFWVIPLAIYLLTFILVFARKPPMRHDLVTKAVPLALLPLLVALVTHGTDPIAAVVFLHLFAFFVIAMFCHGELAKDRPMVEHLTEFYLWLSIGGVLGGAFNALVAPVIFTSILEYPIVLILSCLLLPRGPFEPWRSRTRILDIAAPLLAALLTFGLILYVQSFGPGPGPLATAIMFGVPAIISFSFSRRPVRFALAVAGIVWASSYYPGSSGHVLFAKRSFFGVARVTIDPQGGFRQLMHGTTLHGRQSLDPASSQEPSSYYSRSGPIGQFFRALHDKGRLNGVAVVGLGAGEISSYAQPGEKWTYYEIDPAVESIARDPRYFTYLQHCKADLEVVLGDGRLKLAAAQDGAYDVLILDAYSSDSVPVHLITREAIQLYLKKISRNGILVFHISNRYLDLEPVLGNLAANAGLSALAQSDDDVSPSEARQGKTSSSYVLICRVRADLEPVATSPRWHDARTRPDMAAWTDDYSSILAILRWHR